MPARAPVQKAYPPVSGWTRYRFAEPTAFVCAQCHQSKKAKLFATRDPDWTTGICNSCYGKLLSEP